MQATAYPPRLMGTVPSTSDSPVSERKYGASFVPRPAAVVFDEAGENLVDVHGGLKADQLPDPAVRESRLFLLLTFPY